MTDYRAQVNKRYLTSLSEVRKRLPVKAIEYLNAKSSKYEISTLSRYASTLESFFIFLHENYLPETPIKEISQEQIAAVTPEMTDNYMSWLQSYEYNGVKYHNANPSKKNKLSCLRSFYNYLYSRGYVSLNPAALTELPKLNRKAIFALDRKEQYAMVSSALVGTYLSEKQRLVRDKVSLRDTAIICILLGTGIRVSELVGLNVDDVFFDNNHRGHLGVTRKGGNYDTVYFNKDVYTALKDYITCERPAIKRIARDEDALFISQKHERLTVRSVERLVKIYCEGTHIKKELMHPHLLRASFASSAVETNPLTSVAAAMGHADTSTTSRYYTKVTDDAKKAVADSVKLNLDDPT